MNFINNFPVFMTRALLTDKMTPIELSSPTRPFNPEDRRSGTKPSPDTLGKPQEELPVRSKEVTTSKVDSSNLNHEANTIWRNETLTIMLFISARVIQLLSYAYGKDKETGQLPCGSVMLFVVVYIGSGTLAILAAAHADPSLYRFIDDVTVEQPSSGPRGSLSPPAARNQEKEEPGSLRAFFNFLFWRNREEFFAKLGVGFVVAIGDALQYSALALLPSEIWAVQQQMRAVCVCLFLYLIRSMVLGFSRYCFLSNLVLSIGVFSVAPGSSAAANSQHEEYGPRYNIVLGSVVMLTGQMICALGALLEETIFKVEELSASKGEDDVDDGKDVSEMTVMGSGVSQPEVVTSGGRYRGDQQLIAKKISISSRLTKLAGMHEGRDMNREWQVYEETGGAMPAKMGNAPARAFRRFAHAHLLLAVLIFPFAVYEGRFLKMLGSSEALDLLEEKHIFHGFEKSETLVALMACVCYIHMRSLTSTYVSALAVSIGQTAANVPFFFFAVLLLGAKGGVLKWLGLLGVLSAAVGYAFTDKPGVAAREAGKFRRVLGRFPIPFPFRRPHS